MSDAPTRRVAQWAEQPAIVELYTLDLTPIEPQLPDNVRVWRFSPDANELGQNILWNGHRYTRVPIIAEGFKVVGRGAMPRPSLRVSNLGGAMSLLCIAYKDLVGARLVRQRTYARFLPSENFAETNPFANENQAFPADVFYVRRKVVETPEAVEFELAWVFDLEGVQLPRRAIIADTCTWQYKSAECEWVPGAGPYFDETDAPCSAQKDFCSLRLSGCEKRFHTRHGRGFALPFGGFPGVRVQNDD